MLSVFRSGKSVFPLKLPKLEYGEFTNSAAYVRMAIFGSALFAVPLMVQFDPVFFLLFLFAILAFLVKDLARILASFRSERNWSERNFQADSQAALKNSDAIDEDFVDREYKLPEIEMPKTSRLNSFVGELVIAAVSIVFGFAIAILLKAQAANWQLITAAVAILAILLLSIPRVQVLTKAWKPMTPIRRRTQMAFAKTAFHKYHQHVLHSLNFQTSGFFQIDKKKSAEILISADGLTWAMLSCIQLPEGNQHGCEFFSLTNDAKLISTAVRANDQDTEDVKDEDKLTVAFQKHIREAEQCCQLQHAKLAKISESEILGVLQYFAILEKQKQQRMLVANAEILQGWDWVPHWMRTPLMNPMVARDNS